MDRCTETACYAIGLIRTVVSDNVYLEEVTWIIEIVNADEEPPDHELLLVGGDEDREAGSRCAVRCCLSGPAEAGDGQQKQVARE
jgi:hypothetical protein